MKPKRNYRNCGLPGHWARKCRKPKNVKKWKEKNTRNERKECKENQDEALDNQRYTEHPLLWSSGRVNQMDLTWYIDSGASQHMSYDKERMVDYVQFANRQKVRLGDNRVSKHCGKEIFA